MGFIDFTNGEVLTADQMDLVMRQGIMRFADAAARDTALSEVLAEGMMAYLDDTNEVLKYDGTSWIDISGDITGVTAGTALTGGGTSGDVTLDVDESALTIAQSQVTDLVSDLADKQDDVITTQGDLVIGDASGDPVRLPVGSADQVLTSDGTTVSFQDAGGGGGIEEYTLITSGTLSSQTLNITSIPSVYDDLILRFNFADEARFRANNVSSRDYSQLRSTSDSVPNQGLEDELRVDIMRGEIRFFDYNNACSLVAKGREDFSVEPVFFLGRLPGNPVSSIQTVDTNSGTFELYGVNFV